MVIYGVNEVSYLLRTSQTNAYKVMRELKKEMEAKGLLTPSQGKIQAKYFCERFGFELAECTEELEGMPPKAKRQNKTKEAS